MSLKSVAKDPLSQSESPSDNQPSEVQPERSEENVNVKAKVLSDPLSQSESPSDDQPSKDQPERSEENVNVKAKVFSDPLSQSESASDDQPKDQPERSGENVNVKAKVLSDPLFQSESASDDQAKGKTERSGENVNVKTKALSDLLSQSESASDDQPKDQPERSEDNNENRSRTAEVPDGLKTLDKMTEIFVRQKVSVLEIFTDFETRNKYKIKDKKKNTIYSVKEKSNCCIRNIFGASRSFEMRIKENNNEVIRIKKERLCCGKELTVEAPPKTTIGYVKKKRCSCCVPGVYIKDKEGNQYLTIQGPCLIFEFCRNIKFRAKEIDGKPEVITKQPRGCMRTCYTHASKYHIEFPDTFDVEKKATLLGACLFIDVLYFGNSGKLFSKIIRLLRHLGGMIT